MTNMGTSKPVHYECFSGGLFCPCARSRGRLSDPTQEVRDPVGDQGRERCEGDEHVKIEFHESSPLT